MTICTITMKDGRSMVFSLCPEKAPLTTASFADIWPTAVFMTAFASAAL